MGCKLTKEFIITESLEDWRKEPTLLNPNRLSLNLYFLPNNVRNFISRLRNKTIFIGIFPKHKRSYVIKKINSTYRTLFDISHSMILLEKKMNMMDACRELLCYIDIIKMEISRFNLNTKLMVDKYKINEKIIKKYDTEIYIVSILSS